ncbi:hypothetical protein SGPA1_60185 [Streptomyces misionensis JCM 4497]
MPGRPPDGHVHADRPDPRRPGGTRRGGGGGQEVRTGLRGALGAAAAACLHRRGGPGHGRAARGAGRPQAELRRRVLRHPPRRDLRRSLPGPGGPRGPGRGAGPLPGLPHGEPGADRGLRDRLQGLRRGLRTADGLPARRQRYDIRPGRRPPQGLLPRAGRAPPPRGRPAPRTGRGPGHHRCDRGDVRPGRLGAAARGADLGDEGPRRRGPARPLGQLLRTRRLGPLHEPDDGQRRRELPGPAARLHRPRAAREGRAGLREGVPGLRRGPRLGLAELHVLAGPGHGRAAPHPRAGRGTDRGGRHHPRPGDPLPLGPVPVPPAVLGPPPHLCRRRPHRLRPGQHLHRLRDRHLPAARHPAGPRQALLLTPPRPRDPGPGAGTKHSRKLCRLTDVADRTLGARSTPL